VTLEQGFGFVCGGIDSGLLAGCLSCWVCGCRKGAAVIHDACDGSTKLYFLSLDVNQVYQTCRRLRSNWIPVSQKPRHQFRDGNRETVT